MKKNRLFTVVGIVIALCIAIALYIFVPPKSTKNIPELSSIEYPKVCVNLQTDVR